jgi:NitT/TauT family transport system substrate-binding protein
MAIFRTATIIAGIAMLASFAGIRPAPALSQNTPLRIATSPSDLGAQVYYAKELGLFSHNGLDVDISPVSNGADMIAALVGGSLDIGWSSVIPIASAHVRGIGLTILATATVYSASAPTSGMLVVTKSSPIHSGKDLNGKTIAILGIHSNSDVSVREWIDRNGGDDKTIHLLELPYAQMADAVTAGRVDAASIDNTGDVLFGKPDDPLRVVGNTFDAIAPRFSGSVWFSSSDWVAKHPDEARKFIAAIKEASIWANAHHRESAEILAKYTKRSVEQIEGVPRRTTYGYAATTELIQPTIDIAAKYKLIPSAFPARDLISPLAINSDR